MEKGTIIYIGGFELPDKNAAAHRVIANGKILQNLGYNVCYTGISKNNSYTNKSYFGFQSKAIQYPSSGFSWFKYITTFKYYKKIIESYTDVHAIICYNLPAVSLYRLYTYCKLKNIKIFSDCTEWYVVSRKGDFVTRVVKSLDINLRMRLIHPKLDGIITISAFLDAYYAKKGVKTVQIPPLVDIQDCKWPHKVTHNTSNVKRLIYSGSPFALVQGAAVKDRLDMIIDSLFYLQKKYTDFELTILGMDEDGFLTVFPEFRNKLGSLGNKIIWKGRVSHEVALEYLKSSDYSIFLRDVNLVTTAGFPTKFVESISCGIPVLTNRNSNLEDYLVEGHNGFWINTESVQTVTASLSKILQKDSYSIAQLKEQVLAQNPFDYREFTAPLKNFLK